MKFRKSISAILALVMVLSLTVSIFTTIASADAPAVPDTVTIGSVDEAIGTGDVVLYNSYAELLTEDFYWCYVIQLKPVARPAVANTWEVVASAKGPGLDNAAFTKPEAGEENANFKAALTAMGITDAEGNLYVAIDSRYANAAGIAAKFVKGNAAVFSAAPAAGVTLTAKTTAPEVETYTTVDSSNGVWGGTEVPGASYTVDHELKANGDLVIEVVSNGTVTACALTDKAPTQGVGSFVRVWFQDTAAKVGGSDVFTYTSFMDIAYVGNNGVNSDTYNRLQVNTVPFGNSSTTKYGYNDGAYDFASKGTQPADRPYTVESVVDGDKWTVTITLPAGVVAADNKNVQYTTTVDFKDGDAAGRLWYDGNGNDSVLAQSSIGELWIWDSADAFCVSEASEPGKSGVVVGSAVNAGVTGYTKIDLSAATTVGSASGGYNGNILDGVLAAPGDYASDGTAWRSFYKTEGDIIDLGATYKSVAQIKFHNWLHTTPGCNAPTSVAVYASNNGTDWSLVEIKATSFTAATETATAVWQTIEFENFVEARYFAIVNNGTANAYISEVEFYAKAPEVNYENDITVEVDSAEVAITGTANGAWTAPAPESDDPAQSVLVDGKWALDAAGWNGCPAGAVLFNNKVTTDGSKNPEVAVIFKAEDVLAFDTIELGLYADSSVMVGYPELVKVYTSDDAYNWVAEKVHSGVSTVYTKFDVEDGENGITKPGTVVDRVVLQEDVTAKYVKLVFAFPDSPFTVDNGYAEDQAKPVWEFFCITEIAFDDYGLNGEDLDDIDTWPWTDVDETDTWQLDSTPDGADKFDFSYIMEEDADGTFLVGIKYEGDLTGTAEKFGNGNGTNFRLWFNNMGKAATYTALMDISWNGTDFVVSAKTPDGNNFYKYTDTNTTYSLEWFYTEDGVVIVVEIPVEDLRAYFDVLETSTFYLTAISASNNKGTNYCLHSTNSTVAPTSAAGWVGADVHGTIYAEGLTIVPDADVTAQKGGAALADKGLAWLTDGDIKAGVTAHNTDGVVLFKNGKRGEADVHPTVEFVWAFGEATELNTIAMALYAESNSNVGRPEVAGVYVSEDGWNWVAVDNFIHNVEPATAAFVTTPSLGVTENFVTFTTETATYFKVVLTYGECPTSGAVNWSYFGMTEIAIAYNESSDWVVDYKEFFTYYAGDFTNLDEGAYGFAFQTDLDYDAEFTLLDSGMAIAVDGVETKAENGKLTAIIPKGEHLVRIYRYAENTSFESGSTVKDIYPVLGTGRGVAVEFTKWGDVIYTYTSELNTTVTVPADAFELFAVAGETYNADDAVNGVITVELPAGEYTFTFVAADDAEVGYINVIEWVEGDAEHAEDLVIGENTATVTDNLADGMYFTYTATATGKLTLTMNSEAWNVVVNNETAGVYGDFIFSGDEGVSNVIVVPVVKGDVVTVAVGTGDAYEVYPNPAGEVKFTAAFEEAKVYGSFNNDGYNGVNTWGGSFHTIYTPAYNDKYTTGIEWWISIVLEWDTEAEGWKVVAKVPNGTKERTALTENQIAIVAHYDGAGAYNAVNGVTANLEKLAVGDILYIAVGLESVDELVAEVNLFGGAYSTDKDMLNGTLLAGKADDGEGDGEGDGEDEAYAIGDVNNDGKVDSYDYIIVRAMVLGIAPESITGDELAVAAADVTGDGKVDNYDYIKVRAAVLGLTTLAPEADAE